MLEELGCGNGWLVSRLRNQAGNNLEQGIIQQGAFQELGVRCQTKKLSWNIGWMVISSLL